MGYNGSPPGHAHCNEVGCLMSGTGHCMRTIHAEMNAILNSYGDLSGCWMYVSHQPCIDCTKLAIAVGIKNICFYRKKEYPDLLTYYKDLPLDISMHFLDLYEINAPAPTEQTA